MAVGRTTLGAIMACCMLVTGASLAQVQSPPELPKSWIPERKPAGDGRTAKVEPPLSEAEKREQASETAASPPDIAEQTVIECLARAAEARTVLAQPNGQGPQKASREFAEPFTRARNLITNRNYSEALPLLDEAARHILDPAQELAVEQLRSAAYAGANQVPELVLSLERQLLTGALPLAAAEQHCLTIMRLVQQLGDQPSAAEPLTAPE